MRLHIVSDLHNECESFSLPSVSSDVLILAGDTNIGFKGLSWAANESCGRHLIYIIGNHEYYGSSLPELRMHFRRQEKYNNINILDDAELILGNIRFIGCTLWTDFELFGVDRKPFGIYESLQTVSDYTAIKLGADLGYRALRPSDTIAFHWKSRRFLISKLLQPFAGRTVVITHHAPSPRSIKACFADDPVSSSFCSNLEDLIMQYQPSLWIHGHIHQRLDYTIAGTRVICNPKGYAAEGEVRGFDPGLVLEI